MEIVFKILFAFGLVILLALLLAYPTMWLWNYVMPYIFTLRKIDFEHALALNVLCGILFNHSSSK